MSIKRIRNEKFDPYIDNEGYFKDGTILHSSVGKDTPTSIQTIQENLKPHMRLFYHHTLSTARRHANFVNDKSPADSLDVILASEYNHSDDLFLNKEAVFKQPETNEKITFRRLRNTKDVFIKPKVPLSHPLVRGGITERVSIHSVKLTNSGVHSQITNHGFSRQNVDGNFYNY